MANEVAKREESAVAEYGSGINFSDLLAEELDGLTPSFERIKIPAGGGLAYEVPGDDPDSPDSVKEFKAVILYHHPINCYYKEEYTGGNNPPDCGSMDGKLGIDAETGECKTAPSASSISSAAERTAQRLASRNAESIFSVRVRHCRPSFRCPRAVSANSVNTLCACFPRAERRTAW